MVKIPHDRGSAALGMVETGMSQQQTIYLRVGSFVPWSYCVWGEPFYCPRPSEVAEVEGSSVHRMDVTSHETRGPWREYAAPKFLFVLLKDGRRFRLPYGMLWSEQGWFVECWLNPVYDEPLTLEEFERRQEEEAEMDWESVN